MNNPTAHFVVRHWRWAVAGLLLLVAALALLFHFNDSPQERDVAKSPPSKEKITLPRSNPSAVAPRLVETFPLRTPNTAPNAIQEQGSFWSSPQFRDAPEWAGTLPVDATVQLYWKGGVLPPAARETVIERSNFHKIELYSTRFSMKDLQDAQARLMPEWTTKGICGSSIPIGTDTIELSTDRDPTTIELPQETAEGIPLIIEKSGCAVAL